MFQHQNLQYPSQKLASQQQVSHQEIKPHQQLSHSIIHCSNA